MTIHLACMDAVAFLGGLNGAGIHVCVTDPAYASLEKHRSKGTTTRLSQSKSSSNEWFEIFPNERYGEFFTTLYGAMARDGLVYVFTDAESFPIMKAAADAAGFTFWNLLTWDKQKIGMGYHWRRSTEFVMFLSKNHGRRLNSNSHPDLLSFKAVRDGYPTEKPLDLVQHLLANSMDMGDRVVDPFCGSGVVGEAAAAVGADSIHLNDISSSAIGHTKRRLIALPEVHTAHKMHVFQGTTHEHLWEPGQWG